MKSNYFKTNYELVFIQTSLFENVRKIEIASFILEENFKRYLLTEQAGGSVTLASLLPINLETGLLFISKPNVIISAITAAV